MKTWTYKQAGVPHLKGDPAYNREIRALINRSRIPGVVGKPGGFSSLFDPKKIGVRDPILVSTTDGVGTKLELARLLKRHDTIGIDLVAMCVNDLLTVGARPIFFLDYFATGKFKPPVTREVLKGIVRGCLEAGCALAGGETAVMPDFYSDSRYDLAGFAVGIVERNRVIDGRRVRAGDRLLGLASSGFHSNGFSLLRKIFSPGELKGPVGRSLLTPTRIYVKPVLEVVKKISVKGIVNITGGAFYDNLPRVLPKGLGARIDTHTWPQPKLFETVRKRAKIPPLVPHPTLSPKRGEGGGEGSVRDEMFWTFNMGIGMILILEKKVLGLAQKILRHFKLSNWEIGEVVSRKGVTIL